MPEQQDDLTSTRFPWWRSGFDLEGLVGGVAAWLVGLLLGIIWGPLFWIGFIAAIVILFATRTAERTTVGDAQSVIAPVDGTLVSVEPATPPGEMRLEGDGWMRLRISSSPGSSNGVHAPVVGILRNIVRISGKPAMALAIDPDGDGMEEAHITVVSGEQSLGLRLATGGLGPRLVVHSASGDAVRLGRIIGTRRLGGWCDLYVPAGAHVTATPGITLTCGETQLARLPAVDEDASIADPQETVYEEEVVTAPSEEAAMTAAAGLATASGTHVPEAQPDVGGTGLSSAPESVVIPDAAPPAASAQSGPAFDTPQAEVPPQTGYTTSTPGFAQEPPTEDLQSDQSMDSELFDPSPANESVSPAPEQPVFTVPPEDAPAPETPGQDGGFAPSAPQPVNDGSQAGSEDGGNPDDPAAMFERLRRAADNQDRND